MEVINDTNTLLVSFLTSLKRDFGLLTTLLLSTPKSAYLLKKAQFIARYAEHFDCTSKARAFWVLANLNELLINKVNSSRHFEAFKKKQPSFLNKLSKRLHHLLIESSDPIQLIKSTDSEHTLFFINPNPIHLWSFCDQTSTYSYTIRAEELIQIMDCLAKIKGKFILLHPKSAALIAYSKKFNRHLKPFISSNSNSLPYQTKNELLLVCNYTL